MVVIIDKAINNADSSRVIGMSVKKDELKKKATYSKVPLNPTFRFALTE